MSPIEVTTILAILTAGYPDYPPGKDEMSEEEVATWERHLASTDFDVAVTTAEAIIDHQRWFPRISEFRQVAEPIARRRVMSTPSLPPAAQDRASDKERGLAHIAELRAQLRGEVT